MARIIVEAIKMINEKEKKYCLGVIRIPNSGETRPDTRQHKSCAYETDE